MQRCSLIFASTLALAFALSLAGPASAAPLVLDGTGVLGPRTATLGGVQTFSTVTLVNGARLYVTPFNGTDRVNTGNLVLKADSITIDATSLISAKGAGYRPVLCGNGNGPAAFPASGGRGGCGVRDSGGGGAHLGNGGRGTKDSPTSFPLGYEEDCAGQVNGTGTACVSATDCRNGDGLPTVAGQSFQHSPWAVEFGAAGGDKGCRDGTGFTPTNGTVALAGGAGGGRLVLMATNASQTGTLTVSGAIRADGARGCGDGSDSGGGGAGGSILLIGDSVTVGATALVSAAGGRGGDTQPKCLPCSAAADCGTGSGQTCVSGRCSPCNCTPCSSNAQCLSALGQTCRALSGNLGNVCADAAGNCTPVDPTYEEGECAGTQNSGTCDDCGGGGGGGEVRVLSRQVAALSPLATFKVSGASGGVCPVCTGEAGGGAGELQVDGAYLGEICDGQDNDFNGSTDDGLPALDCSGTPLSSCVGGVPQQCPVNKPACVGPVTDTRPRFVLLVDSSSSMLNDVAGKPTFGDGSAAHLGVDTSSDSDTVDGNNSRLSIAKAAVNNILAAFPNAGFALARFHQDVSANRSCLAAKWLECEKACCSYDDPRDNVAPAFPIVPGCNLSALYSAGYPASLGVNLNTGWSTPADCINYSGTCGLPRRGADLLVGFDKPLQQSLMWIDGQETRFDPSTTPGDHCSFSAGGDCELRANGPRPLADALDGVADYLKPIVDCDAAVPCRKYSVILLTTGAESCRGNPVAAATALRTAVPGTTINTYVIGLSALPSEQAQLNAIAAAGGTGSAFFASNQSSLANALASISASASVTERCNGLDDDCDGLIDEDYPAKGQPCDDGQRGVCRGTGVLVCGASGVNTVCMVTSPGLAAGAEVCNGLDDDCDGLVDEGGICGACTPSPELCNGEDDDCNGLIDDAPIDANVTCGLVLGECAPGLTACTAGVLDCVGGVGPQAETCNGLDDDCDGVIDGLAATCYPGPTGTSGVGACHPGTQACTAVPGSGVTAWGPCVGAALPSVEVCDGIDQDCNGATDDAAIDATGHVTGEPCCAFGALCGVGACTSGQWACAGSQVVCSGGTGPALETCNGRDDDCNGVSDDVPGHDGPCLTASRCAGVLRCDLASGAAVCRPNLALELCNGADDDCDGTVDEEGEIARNDPRIGATCQAPVAPNDRAPCQAGVTKCLHGAVTCVGAVVPDEERCNGVDDDCDGATDDGAASCPAGAECHLGACRIPCPTGPSACPGLFHCVDGWCVKPPDEGWPDSGQPPDADRPAGADAAVPGLDSGVLSAGDAAGVADATLSLPDGSSGPAADSGSGAMPADGCACQTGGSPVTSSTLGLLLLGLALSSRRKAVRP